MLFSVGSRGAATVYLELLELCIFSSAMYRPDKVPGRPPAPVFGPPLGAVWCGPLYPQSRPPPPHFTPPCNSFSIAQNTTIALGGSQEVIPPAEVHLQVPHWSPNLLEHSIPDSSEKAGEEFLRCIADNKPLPDYLKKNVAYDLAEALKSASFLKEAVKSNHDFQRHKARSKSRSRSRCRSRGRSRARSRCRSTGRAYSQSRARSKSHVRNKICTTRDRSRSRSRSSRTSRAQRSRSRSSGEISCSDIKQRKSSHSGSSSVSSAYSPTATSLLEGLKMIMSSKALVEQLPSLKEALLSTKASDKSTKVPVVACESRSQQAAIEKSSLAQERDNTLLPHERVGSDFSWLQGHSEEDASVQKAKELEEEESFLYGNPLSAQSLRLTPPFTTSGNPPHHKQPCPSHWLASASSCLDSMEFEKVKNILKSLSASSEPSEQTGSVQRQREQCAARHSSDATAHQDLPALGNADVRHALESLQALISATKDKRVKSEGLPHASSDEHKEIDNEQRKPEKSDRMKKMESMEKELEDLLEQDGLHFLTPVIGFYCQKCEEFIGDLKCAEKHSIIHNCSNSSAQKLQIDKDGKESEKKWHHHKHSEASGRRDHKDPDEHKSSKDQRSSVENHRSRERGQGEKCYDADRQAGKKNTALKEELKNDRMQTLPASKVLAAPNHGSVKEETPERKDESPRKSGRSHSQSSDSSGDKSPKPKRSKKKKKKKKKVKKGKGYNS